MPKHSQQKHVVPQNTAMEKAMQRRSREFARLVSDMNFYWPSYGEDDADVLSVKKRHIVRKVKPDAFAVLLGHLEAYPLPESPIPFPFRSPAEMAGWSDAQVLIEYLRVGAAWEHVSTKQQDLGAAHTMARVRGALTWWCSEEGVEGWTAYMDAVGKKGWRKYYSGR